VAVDAWSVPRHGASVEPIYTPTQGQYLAFIYYYTKLNGVPPAEADFQKYFRVSPPSVHQMIVTLVRRGFIERTPGAAWAGRLD
jgi:Mn-dependent DtxR family transcriptional regulator